MKLGIRLFTATILVLGVAVSAQALNITPTSGVLNTTRWEGNQTSQSEIDAIVGPIVAPSTELYKSNVGGSEEGSLAGSYHTVFSNTATDPSDATISYTGGAFVGPTAYLLVKDGNQVPAWYLFNLTALGWNGTATLNLTGFWPGNGAISHVSLYGTTATSVPDGGSMAMLLGFALIGLAVTRRMMS